MNHYEVLGVARDATPEQIKQAYRAASSKAHPDKDGGSTEAMAAVNLAYETLSDPERRKRYDETGQDRPARSLQDDAVSALADMFQEGIAKGVADLVAFCRGEVIARSMGCREEMAKAQRFIVKLTTQRGTVRVKKEGSPNLVHGLIDAHIAAQRKTIEGNERMIELGKAVEVLLDDYEFTGDVPGAFGGLEATLLAGAARRGGHRYADPFAEFFNRGGRGL